MPDDVGLRDLAQLAVESAGSNYTACASVHVHGRTCRMRWYHPHPHEWRAPINSVGMALVTLRHPILKHRLQLVLAQDTLYLVASTVWYFIDTGT